MSSSFQKSFCAKTPFKQVDKGSKELDAIEAGTSTNAVEPVEISNATKPIVPGRGMKGTTPELTNILERTLYDDDDSGIESLSSIPQKEINRANQSYKEKTNDPEVQNDPRARKPYFKK